MAIWLVPVMNEVPVSISGLDRLEAARLYRLHHVSACSQKQSRRSSGLVPSLVRQRSAWLAGSGKRFSDVASRLYQCPEQNHIESSRQTLANIPHKRADLAKGPNVSKDPAFVALS